MALLTILRYPDPRLRVKAQPVTQIDDNIRRIVEDMYETMYANHGVGLAATQVGIHHRIFVMDVSETRDQKYCAINPEIISHEGIQTEVEGCLSVGGGIYDKINRPLKARLRAMDIDGNTYELEGENLMAACFQHEINHLDGILFIDHLSRLKQERIREKVEKSKRRA
ncbi:MAG TPA: peptide deformylase [Gammaproteobacteria bacterium]|jgi:peptide deformylase|nr:peptide deformylase [Gammaproteobacteria bacterium]